MKTINFYRVGILCAGLLLIACSNDDDKDGGKKDKTVAGSCKANTLAVKSIYGADDRRDWYQVSDPALVGWAGSTVALINRQEMTAKINAFDISAISYQESRKLCPGQPFLNQPTAAYCSGFYVGNDLIVTAGHCVTSQATCQQTAFVFDYALEQAGRIPVSVPSENVYGCKTLVAQKFGADDFALIQVDRPIVNRVPFQIRRQGAPAVGEGLTMIGHPAGLPSKISDGGAVMSLGNRIIADVDAFAGNSGSAIIDRSTGRIEGILVMGNADFDNAGTCFTEHVCGADCDGEKIFPITRIQQLIPPPGGSNTSESTLPQERLCN